MCIIVYKPADIDVDDNILQNCYNNNPDGAGFLVKLDDGSLKTEKGFFNFDTFLKAIKPFRKNEFTLHFRIKTHGLVNADNTHPFWVFENQLAFAHNGVFNKIDCPNPNYSDTWHFNEKILKPFLTKMGGPEALEEEFVRDLILGYIDFSKLVFMREGLENGTWIFNESKGTFVNTVWFSNTSFRSSVSSYTTSTTTKKTYLSKENHFNINNEFCIGDVVELCFDSLGGEGRKGDFGRIIKHGEGSFWDLELWTENTNWEESKTISLPYWRFKKVNLSD